MTLYRMLLDVIKAKHCRLKPSFIELPKIVEPLPGPILINQMTIMPSLQKVINFVQIMVHTGYR